MRDLGPFARAIVESAREGDRSTAADRARIRARLARSIAAGAVVTTAGATAKAASASAAAAKISTTAPWLFALKVIAPVAIAATVGAGVVAERSAAQRRVDEQRAAAPALVAPPSTGRRDVVRVAPAESPDPSTAEEAPAPSAAASSAPPPIAAAAPLPSASGASRNAAPNKARATAAPDPLSGEIERLRAVDGALRSGEPGRALALLDQPSANGQELDEERFAARAIALCRLGRFDEGRAAMNALLLRSPRSPHAERVRAACADK